MNSAMSSLNGFSSRLEQRRQAAAKARAEKEQVKKAEDATQKMEE